MDPFQIPIKPIKISTLFISANIHSFFLIFIVDIHFMRNIFAHVCHSSLMKTEALLHKSFFFFPHISTHLFVFCARIYYFENVELQKAYIELCWQLMEKNFQLTQFSFPRAHSWQRNFWNFNSIVERKFLLLYAACVISFGYEKKKKGGETRNYVRF